jgi:hypothetical protein
MMRRREKHEMKGHHTYIQSLSIFRPTYVLLFPVLLDKRATRLGDRPQTGRFRSFLSVF